MQPGKIVNQEPLIQTDGVFRVPVRAAFMDDREVVGWFDENYLPPLFPISEYNAAGILFSAKWYWLKKQWLCNPENEAWYQVRLAVVLGLAKKLRKQFDARNLEFEKIHLSGLAYRQELSATCVGLEKDIVELTAQLSDRHACFSRIAAVLSDRKLSDARKLKSLKKLLKGQ